MSTFPDHFSGTAESYASFRPGYPADLFDWLARHSRRTERAWDAGTGSGQAAIGLARHFADVVATDPSLSQLEHATRTPNVHYAAMTAEGCALAAASVDLVTVAQALHWFDPAAFHREVRRVLRPGGLLAVWTYGLVHIAPDIDDRITTFYKETVGPYWPPERALVDAGYADIDFPYTELSSPEFRMTEMWTLAQFTGYVGTWSAVSRYRQATGSDPVPELQSELGPLWGGVADARLMSWPLELRVGSM